MFQAMFSPKAAFASLLCAAVASAQLSYGLPTAGTTIAAGSNFTVRLIQPDEPTTLIPVAVAIGLQTCTDNSNESCGNTDESLGGTLLYEGPFNPQSGPPVYSPYEDFNVTVPADFPSGEAILGTAYFLLLDLALTPTLEVINETITIS